MIAFSVAVTEGSSRKRAAPLREAPSISKPSPYRISAPRASKASR
jgi:hypothetical protein